MTRDWGTWLAAGVLALLGAALLAFGVTTGRSGRKLHERVERMGGTVLLGAWPMDAFYWTLEGLVRLLVRTGVAPSTLTVTSLGLTIAGAPFLAQGDFALGGCLVLAGAMFDVLDGVVARAQNVSSDAGEVLDAVVDRYADAVPLMALAIFYRHAVWQMAVPLAALLGSMTVSYVRAKADAMRISLTSGLMRRHERIFYLGLGLLGGP